MRRYRRPARWRERQALARKMRREGATFKEIGYALGAETLDRAKSMGRYQAR